MGEPNLVTVGFPTFLSANLPCPAKLTVLNKGTGRSGALALSISSIDPKFQPSRSSLSQHVMPDVVVSTGSCSALLHRIGQASPIGLLYHGVGAVGARYFGHEDGDWVC